MPKKTRKKLNQGTKANPHRRIRRICRILTTMMMMMMRPVPKPTPDTATAPAPTPSTAELIVKAPEEAPRNGCGS